MTIKLYWVDTSVHLLVQMARYVCYCLVAKLCLVLCDPVDHSTPGFPVLYCLLEFTHTHVHWFGDAIQPSHPLPSPSPPALNLPQHQGLFQWVSSSHQVAKMLELAAPSSFSQDLFLGRPKPGQHSFIYSQILTRHHLLCVWAKTKPEWEHVIHPVALQGSAWFEETACLVMQSNETWKLCTIIQLRKLKHRNVD